MREERNDEQTTLYRFWGAGELLYVGISVNAYRRASQHGRNAEWWDNADCVTFEHYLNRKAALIAEYKAIKYEEPKYNVIYSTHRVPPVREVAA